MHEDSFHRSLQAAFDRAFPPEEITFPEAPIPDAEYCTAQTLPEFPGSLHRPPEPAEYCDNEAVEGEEYCERHLWMSDSWEEF